METKNNMKNTNNNRALDNALNLKAMETQLRGVTKLHKKLCALNDATTGIDNTLLAQTVHAYVAELAVMSLRAECLLNEN